MYQYCRLHRKRWNCWSHVYSSNFFFSSRRRHTRLTCDWSSDVCSSDLMRHHVSVGLDPLQEAELLQPRDDLLARGEALDLVELGGELVGANRQAAQIVLVEIGRASCRERGEISGVAVSLT